MNEHGARQVSAGLLVERQDPSECLLNVKGVAGSRLASSAESQRKVSPRWVEVVLTQQVEFVASDDAIRCRVED